MRQQILDELDEVMNGDDGEEEAYQSSGSRWVGELMSEWGGE